ncbi:hypothetical protein JOB18_025606 [Solea senegalensis]|uniref:Uncharacterized protein n=1 Tax=Solea senegalensis TaxID=28829 RepID=A0AAV6RSA9_SOLSE|nr:hypothetical protein JOB18_025606 [Solea senegalensis]
MVVKRKGKKMSDTGPLGAWLWEKVKECEVERDETTEKGQKAGRLQRSRIKKEAKQHEEGRRGWSELVVFWQSMRHLHKHRAKSGGKQMVIAPDTPTCPPPYALSTPGLYPTLYVTSGTLQVGSTEDTTSQDSVSNSGTHETQQSTHTSVPKSEPPSQVTTENSWLKTNLFGSDTSFTPLDPFSQRREREQQTPGLTTTSATRVQDSEYRVPPQTHTPDQTGTALFRGRGQWEGERAETPVTFDLQGEWEEGNRSTSPSEIERLRVRQRRTVQRQPELQHASGNYPLTFAPGHRDKYRPFGIGDIQAIVDKLPPVAEGGNLWLSQLDSLTAGQRLALGDFRAIAGRCMTRGDMTDIETQARTYTQPDEQPFTQYSTAIGRAMREKYPLPNATVMPKMRWDPKQNPRDYIDKGKDTWLKYTGSHPGKAGSQREWFRQAILEGVPENVKLAMIEQRVSRKI